MPNLLENIIWSDEAVFHLGGFVNRHNSHYWAQETPKKLLKKSQSKPKVTVWCGITATRVIGPFFLRDTMNGERYHHMLEDFIIQEINQMNKDHVIFMQDGAPPHYANFVQDLLNNSFPGRWIGRRGPYDWPACSPDLIPCDFFLWGCVKDQAYRRVPQTIDELEDAIHDVISNVPLEFLRKAVTKDVPRRL